MTDSAVTDTGTDTRFGIGYTLMTEQSGPRELVGYAAGAEQAGFDFEVISDHYSPWIDEQGHAAYAWAILGAVTQVTSRVGLMTYVTCPTVRYHPAVVAQKAATIALLSKDRFTLGLGAGENLNEHIVARGWPPANVRQEMLQEALEIISALFDGGYVNHVGRHFRVDSAKLWDLPQRRVPIATAVSGAASIGRLAPLSDVMIAVEPEADLVRQWDAARADRNTGSSGPRVAQDTGSSGPRVDQDTGSSGPRVAQDTGQNVSESRVLGGSGTGGRGDTGDRGAEGRGRKVGQQPICWGRDKDAAVKLAHEQFRWFGGGWKVNAELPGTAGFAGATQFVRPEDVAGSIPCGPDVGAIVEAVRPWWEAGFTDVALVQVGDVGQEEFLDFAGSDLLPALREAAP